MVFRRKNKGGCFSDIKGGKQAIHGLHQTPTPMAEPSTSVVAGAPNDAVDFFYRARGQYPLYAQLELSFSASNLRDRDITSKSDPMIVAYAKKMDGKLEELGRTEAIMEVGEVIQFYDSNRRFPAWGFGGRKPDGVVSHCFNLNGDGSTFEVEGVVGIMDAYANALRTVSLAGPTLFGQVVHRAAHWTVSLARQQQDGVLTDLQETKDALVKASDLPLSVLIVGVGGADFSQMEILDADNGRRLESSQGRVATRDIIQFVSMREVHSGQKSVVQAHYWKNYRDSF